MGMCTILNDMHFHAWFYIMLHNINVKWIRTVHNANIAYMIRDINKMVRRLYKRVEKIRLA